MNKIQKLRKNGEELYLNGRVGEALKVYHKMVKNPFYEKLCNVKDKVNDLHGMFSMSNYLGLHNDALQYAKNIFSLKPNDVDSIITLSKGFHFVKSPEQAIKYALLAERSDDANYEVYDILSENYMLISDFENARASGIKSLLLKEKEVDSYPSHREADVSVKSLNKNDKSKNIISFSLFGDSPRYCENAVINSIKAPEIYPHWTCRFYCSDNVPVDVIERLKNNGAEVIFKKTSKDPKDMLFWRFLVMSDKTIDRYIVRDCDSVVNLKEAVAVDDWIESNKSFHILRDYYTHATLILAGMFGGVSGVFSDVEKMIDSFHKNIHTSRTHLDQDFLAQYVWPSIKTDVMIHDSCFHSSDCGSVDFPENAMIIKNHHIGMNEGAATLNVKLGEKTACEKVKWSILDKNNTTICTYHSRIVNGAYCAEIPTSYVGKLQNKEYMLKSVPY
ncbi:Uncharacterised protein [Zhongshania aliphaticivorans]|uniref:Tetratricopeptide repeat protein n=1 Tax=Zhongshania aliphaticivorans TaxID=1470434 RepID=A0A5S9MX90_9GAMM|nr:hypothetical protein [Zhongshania aliphaticivorans]CAA0081342.1 Uncharacterised protein [Zhongshania aliphaticivorans]CAA0084953.1 Uncharacterised protein [Zhongshania aliphaticivorans]